MFKDFRKKHHLKNVDLSDILAKAKHYIDELYQSPEEENDLKKTLSELASSWVSTTRDHGNGADKDTANDVDCFDDIFRIFDRNDAKFSRELDEPESEPEPEPEPEPKSKPRSEVSLPRFSIDDDDVTPWESGIRYSISSASEEDDFPRSFLDASRAGQSSHILMDSLNKKVEMSFVDKMIDYINKKNMRDSQVYRAANIDRRLFSRMVNNRSYTPAKDTCIALCFALQLDINETKDMLTRAGYALSHSNKRDLVLEYLIRERVYNMFEVNEILDRLEMKPLSV